MKLLSSQCIPSGYSVLLATILSYTSCSSAERFDGGDEVGFADAVGVGVTVGVTLGGGVTVGVALGGGVTVGVALGGGVTVGVDDGPAECVTSGKSTTTVNLKA